MTEQPRLHHLLDRMLRGVLLEAEGEQLVGLVTELEQHLADADQDAAEAREHNEQTCEAVTGRDAAEARINLIRDAARLHRQQLLSTSELYAVIEALDPLPTPTTT